MTVLKRRPTRTGRWALWAWTAVALTPVGCVLGIVLAFFSGEGEAKGIGPVTLGVLGIAVVVSGSLLLATLVLTLLLGRIGLVVVAEVAVLVFVGSRSRNKPSPPGSDNVQREGGSPAATTPPGAW
jgi:hypothetical protein